MAGSHDGLLSRRMYSELLERGASENQVEVATYEEALVAHARYLGLLEDSDWPYYGVVAEALTAPTPVGWEIGNDQEGNMYYHHTDSGQYSWSHPLDDAYRARCSELKRKHENGEIDMNLDDDEDESGPAGGPAAAAQELANPAEDDDDSAVDGKQGAPVAQNGNHLLSEALGSEQEGPESDRLQTQDTRGSTGSQHYADESRRGRDRRDRAQARAGDSPSNDVGSRWAQAQDSQHFIVEPPSDALESRAMGSEHSGRPHSATSGSAGGDNEARWKRNHVSAPTAAGDQSQEDIAAGAGADSLDWPVPGAEGAPQEREATAGGWVDDGDADADSLDGEDFPPPPGGPAGGETEAWQRSEGGFEKQGRAKDATSRRVIGQSRAAAAPDTPGGLSDILNGGLDSEVFDSPTPEKPAAQGGSESGLPAGGEQEGYSLAAESPEVSGGAALAAAMLFAADEEEEETGADDADQTASAAAGGRSEATAKDAAVGGTVEAPPVRKDAAVSATVEAPPVREQVAVRGTPDDDDDVSRRLALDTSFVGETTGAVREAGGAGEGVEEGESEDEDEASIGTGASHTQPSTAAPTPQGGAKSPLGSPQKPEAGTSGTPSGESADASAGRQATEEVRELQQRLAAADAELRVLKEGRAASRESTARLRAAEQELEELRSQQREAATSGDKAKGMLQQRLDELRTKHREALEQLEASRQATEDSQGRVRELEGNLAAENRKYKRLEEDLRSETERGKEADAELELVRKRMSETARTHGAAAGAAQDEIERLRGELDTVKKDLERATKRAAESRDRAADEAQALRVRADGSEREAERRTREAATAKEEASSALAKLETTRKQLEEESEQHRAQVADLSRKLDEAAATASAAKVRATEEAQRAGRKQNELDRKIAELEARLESEARASREQREAATESARQQTEQAAAQVAKLQAEIRELQKDADSRRRNAEAAAAEAAVEMERVQREHTAELASLRESSQGRLQAAVQDAEARAAAAKRAVEVKMEAAELEARALKDDLARTRTQLDTARQQHRDEQQTRTRVEQSERQARSAADRQVGAAQAEAQEAQRLLQEEKAARQRETSGLQSELKGVTQEVAAARGRISELQTEVGRLGQALQEANADSRLAEAENRLREETQRSERLRAVADGQRAELRRVRLDYEARLQQQLDGAKSRITEAAEGAADAAERRTRAELEAKVIAAEEDSRALRARLQALTKELDEASSEARRKSSTEAARHDGELAAARAESERLQKLLEGHLSQSRQPSQPGYGPAAIAQQQQAYLALPPPSAPTSQRSLPHASVQQGGVVPPRLPQRVGSATIHAMQAQSQAQVGHAAPSTASSATGLASQLERSLGPLRSQLRVAMREAATPGSSLVGARSFAGGSGRDSESKDQAEYHGLRGGFGHGTGSEELPREVMQRTGMVQMPRKAGLGASVADREQDYALMAFQEERMRAAAAKQQAARSSGLWGAGPGVVPLPMSAARGEGRLPVRATFGGYADESSLGDASTGDAASLYQAASTKPDVLGLARRLEMSQAAVDVMESMREGWMGGMRGGDQSSRLEGRRHSLGAASGGETSAIGGAATGLEASFASARTASGDRPGYVNGAPLSARKGYFVGKYGR